MKEKDLEQTGTGEATNSPKPSKFKPFVIGGIIIAIILVLTLAFHFSK